MKLQLRVLRFLPTTGGNTNKMRSWSSSAVWRFRCVYLHAQTAVHMHLMNLGYLDHGKTPILPIGAPCLDKDDVGCGISSRCLVTVTYSTIMAVTFIVIPFWFILLNGSTGIDKSTCDVNTRQLTCNDHWSLPCSVCTPCDLGKEFTEQCHSHL